MPFSFNRKILPTLHVYVLYDNLVMQNKQQKKSRLPTAIRWCLASQKESNAISYMEYNDTVKAGILYKFASSIQMLHSLHTMNFLLLEKFMQSRSASSVLMGYPVIMRLKIYFKGHFFLIVITQWINTPIGS